MKTRRYDGAKIVGKIQYTPEGFIKANAVVTRTGIFKYRNADGTTRLEYRPAEEVFREDSLETMKMIPVTKGHPPEFVNKDNAKKYSVGSTGETVETHNDTDVSVSLIITHADAIKAVEGGMRELSLGYDLKLEKTPGDYKGERYDAIQRAIEYNHLAICDKARAGSQATLRFDSEDAFRVDDSETNNPKGDRMIVVINGVQHDVPDAVGNAYGATVARADAAEVMVKELTTKATKAEARADSLESDLKTAKEGTKNTDSEVIAKVNARVRLLSIASKAMDSKEVDTLMNKPDRDVMVAIIGKRSDGFTGEGKTDEYLLARVDHLAEDLAKAPAPKTTQQEGFRKDSADAGRTTRVDDAAVMDAYKRQFEPVKVG